MLLTPSSISLCQEYVAALYIAIENPSKFELKEMATMKTVWR